MPFVGEHLKYLRNLFSLSVLSFAEDIIRTGESNYRKMESSRSGLTFNKAKLICEFFEISLDELFDTDSYSLAIAISRKDENYMNRIFDKIKKFRDVIQKC
jgi:transcriptional regulator with XRE-family HTH domain